MKRHIKVRSSLAIAALLAAGGVPTQALAQAAAPSKLALYGGTAERAKVSSELLHARNLLDRRMSRSEVEAILPNLRFVADAVELDVRLWRLTPEIVARIEAMGFAVRRAHPDVAWLALDGSPDLLEQLAALPEVSTIHPRYAPRLLAGSVDDQADLTTGAGAARAAFGVDGTGTRVGIISDSFNDRIGGQLAGRGCTRTLTGSDPQVSGDLPASVTIVDSGDGPGTDEGAALGELIHDLAPGADLLFRSVGIGEADFADGFDELRTCGATVVVDDVRFLTEPMFQDGLVAQAAQRAVAAGVPVFSAAGNQAGLGVAQTFTDPDVASEQADLPTGIDFNDFGDGTRFASMTIPASCGVTLVLQWNEPFSGTLGAGASTDLDLYLYEQASASSAILASSVDSQGCSRASGSPAGDPFEILTYVNSAPQARTVYMAVNNFCGASSPTFRVATFGTGCGLPGAFVFQSSVFRAPQIYGHAAADGVVAVAAVDYRELDSGGTFVDAAGQIDVESFSSLGGDLPFFFDAAGNPLPGGVQFRFKPDLAAPDGINTTFFGADISGDADVSPNFFGTSAAVPHAAAIAALLREAHAGLGPDDIRRLLAGTARDIARPGLDPLAGAGAIDALAAVAAALASPTMLTSLPSATPTALATTPTPVPSVSPASPTAAPGGLPSDCDADGGVTVAELIRAVRIALGAPVADCPPADRDGDSRVSIDEILTAVIAALASA